MECQAASAPLPRELYGSRRRGWLALAEGDPAQQSHHRQDDHTDGQQRRAKPVAAGIVQHADAEHREAAAGDQQEDPEDQRGDLAAAHRGLPVRAGRPGRWNMLYVSKGMIRPSSVTKWMQERFTPARQKLNRSRKLTTVTRKTRS